MSAAPVLEFADSEAGSALIRGDVLVLRLAAAQVVQNGELGYLLGLELHFEGARWQGDPAACFGRIRHAQLALAGQPPVVRVTLPFAAATVEASVLFHNGAQLQVAAEALRIDAQGARFVPSHAC